MEIPSIIFQILSFLTGAMIVAVTLISAIRTFVLPRSAQDRITGSVFRFIRRIFSILLLHRNNYLERDRILAYFAPVSLLMLVPVWLTLITIGYTLINWAVGEGSFIRSFSVSGSSILTLGFEKPSTGLGLILSFTEAAIGLILIALLIAYLPTMYSAFSRREIQVNLLEVRAGDPPSAFEMLVRFHRIHGLDRLTEQWISWETWFSEIEESHTTLAALVFFRSPKPTHSWVTASGTILDAASLSLSLVDIPNDPNAALCIRAGFLAMRNIADFFKLPYEANPHYPYTPISVTRDEFNKLAENLRREGLPLKSDLEQAWKDYAGWRVNYDSVLNGLALITQAPKSAWVARNNNE